MSRQERLPYPGLRAYERDETDLFFGREGCVDHMVERLATNHFLAVLGASGSGKSSLVRTGLLDALELGFLAEAGPFWTIADCHPGGSPLRNLAQALLAAHDGAPPEAADIDVLYAFLRRGPRSIIEWVNEGNLPKDHNLLLLIDQFEELFRYGDYAGREQAEAFSALLLESARTGVRIHVVITMRSEYLGACALIPGLAEQINTSLYLTRRMTREECRQAIEGPAKVMGFDIEPQLVSRLLNDLSGFAPWDTDRESSQLQRLSRQADQLPLMQHALSRLWQRASSRGTAGRPVLTLQDYLDIGQLQGALDQHASEVIERLSSAARPLVERVFRALVSGASLADAVRRPMRFDRLVVEVGAEQELVAEVVDAFRARDCNFLRPTDDHPLTDDTVIDISHESLIRQWQSLAGWFEEEAQSSALWDRLIYSQERHAAGKGEFLSGLDLVTALDWWRREAPTAGWAESRGGRYEEVDRFLRESEADEEEYTRAEKEREAIERERERKEGRRQKTRATIWFGLFMTALLAAVYGGFLNNRLSTFKDKSANALVKVSEVIDRIQSSNVIGFTGIQKDLFDSLAPLQEHTIAEARDYLSEPDIISLYQTYSASLEKTGDSQNSAKKMAKAFALSNAYLDAQPDLTKVDSSFMAKFFKIVTYHAWNLMNAGDYDGAWDVLEFSALIEHAFQNNVNDPEILAGLARVENVRARYFNDLDQKAAGYDADARVLELQKRAVELSPENDSLVASLVTYLGNAAIQSRHLASVLNTTNSARAETLRQEAIDSDKEKCTLTASALKKNNLNIKFYKSSAACAMQMADQLLADSKSEAADSEILEALKRVDPALISDKDSQELQIARLTLLDKRLNIANLRTLAETAERGKRAQTLLDQWIAIVGNRSTLPIDVFRVQEAYTSLSGYIGRDEIPLQERERLYRLIRAALDLSLQSFPGARKYQEIASDAAYQLAETLRKRGGADDEALQVYDEAISQFRKLGLYDNFEKPSEGSANACGAYSGKADIYRKRKDSDQALKAVKILFAQCEPMVERHDWDLHLRQSLNAGGRVGALLFELGRYEEALPLLEYASHWADGDATRLLSQIYRAGLGVPRDVAKADALLARAGRQSMKRFTVPVDFNGVKYPFHVYVKDWPEDYKYVGIDDQVKWIDEYRGGKVPIDVIESFRKLHKISRENDVSFPDLAVYALGTPSGKLPEEIAKAKVDTNFVPNPAISMDGDGVAISGFDPVSYFEPSGPKAGSESIFTIWKGAVWLFDTVDHRDRFLKEPERYAPAFGGFCAECLAQGHKRHSDPLVWFLDDGKLYFNMSSALRDVWRDKADERLAAANAAWTTMAAQSVKPGDSYRSHPLSHPYIAGAAKLRKALAAIEAKDYEKALLFSKEASLDFGPDLKNTTGPTGPRPMVKYRNALISVLGNLSDKALFTKQDAVALEAADLALALDKYAYWIRANRAHALMFAGRTDEARSIYRLARGAKVPGFDIFEDSVRNDYVKLRAAGRTHPLMDEMAAEMGIDLRQAAPSP